MRRTAAVGVASPALLGMAGCGQEATQSAASEGMVREVRQDTPPAADEGFEAVAWKAHLAGLARVKERYGVDYPDIPARTAKDGPDIVCDAEPPLAQVEREAKALIAKYGPEIRDLAGGDGTPAGDALQAYLDGHSGRPGARSGRILCDRTMVWLETGADPDTPPVVPYEAYDAPAGGHLLGHFDPAKPNRLT